MYPNPEFVRTNGTDGPGITSDFYQTWVQANEGVDAAGALADVNTVRASRSARPSLTPKELTEMTLDILYRERGFEFYWEHQRRTDMIRFGKYEDSWTKKTSSDVQKRVFPIPQPAIDGASNSPGYLVQNLCNYTRWKLI